MFSLALTEFTAEKFCEKYMDGSVPTEEQLEVVNAWLSLIQLSLFDRARGAGKTYVLAAILRSIVSNDEWAMAAATESGRKRGETWRVAKALKQSGPST